MEPYAEAVEHQMEQKANSEKAKIFFRFMEKVGSFGAYQKITLVLLFASTFICGELTFVTPFLFFQDQYSCPYTPPPYTSCGTYVCSLPSDQRVTYLPPITMQTLASKFGDYRCEQSTESFAILIIYIGVVLGYLILSLLAGFCGRKVFVVLGLAISCGGVLMSLLVGNIYVGAVGIMLGLLGIQWVFSVSFTIISEVVDEKYRAQSLVGLQVFYSLGHLSDTGLYFWLRDWEKVFIYFFLIPAAVILVCYTAFTVDTPVALIRQHTPEDALCKFLWIARVNGVESPQIKLEELAQAKQLTQVRQSQEQKSSKFTILDLFRYPSLRWMTLFCLAIQISVAFLYFAPNLMLSRFHMNIFVDGLVLGISYLSSDLLCYFTVKYFKRKHTAVITLSLCLVCSIVLAFLYHPRSIHDVMPVEKNLGVLVLLFVITFAISIEYTFFYIYLTQLYPSQIRVLGISLITFMAAATLAVSQLIIDSSIQAGFPVMVVFCIFAALSIVISFCLPETINTQSKDLIQQLHDRAAEPPAQPPNTTLSNPAPSNPIQSNPMLPKQSESTLLQQSQTTIARPTQTIIVQQCQSKGDGAGGKQQSGVRD